MIPSSRFVEEANPFCAKCHGKERFETPQLALAIWQKMPRRAIRQVYRCEQCHGWHIGEARS